MPHSLRHDLETLLARSAATAAFRDDALAFAAGAPAERIRAGAFAPPVKVARVVCQLLDAEPALAVDAVAIRAVSGCSDYVGTIQVELADGAIRTFEFEWNCRWRAEQEGWHDWFGEPDQIRAARELNWRCFAHWRERPAVEPDGSPAPAGVLA